MRRSRKGMKSGMKDFEAKTSPRQKVDTESWFIECYRNNQGHPLRTLVHLYKGNYHKFVLIKDLCKWKGVEIIEGHMMPDHVHILVSIPPKYSVSQFMGYLKGKSAMMIFERHANLKYKFGNRNFWATGYYVSTVGINTATIQKYIREQEKQDQIEDSLSKKEYVDPFKGSK